MKVSITRQTVHWVEVGELTAQQLRQASLSNDCALVDTLLRAEGAYQALQTDLVTVEVVKKCPTDLPWPEHGHGGPAA